MSIKISNIVEDINNKMTFVLSNVDVSYANGLRRIVLSNIPVVCFKTEPYSENQSVIFENTTRLHNELIKHRLSLIPININYISNPREHPIDKYILEINVENNTDSIMMVTTKDFQVSEVEDNKVVRRLDSKNIFPPYVDSISGQEYYIDFVELKPKLANELRGEKIHLTCKFSLGTAEENACHNAVENCSYGFTVDYEAMNERLNIMKQKWKDENKDVEYEAENWKLLDGKRITIKNSYDFVIKSVGMYENKEIMKYACMILLNKIVNLKTLVETNEITVKKINDWYEVILENEDYTLGNIIHHELMNYYSPKSDNVLKFVGFMKEHPHLNYSKLKMTFVDESKGTEDVKLLLLNACVNASNIANELMKLF